MTYDRVYSLSKIYTYEIEELADSLNMVVEKTENINVENVKLPFERNFKIKMQKFLNKLSLMNYGNEFGEKIILKSKTNNSKLDCKSWCLSDHVIGLEIEYKNIDNHKLTLIQNSFEDKFNNYEIIWTKID